VDEDRSVEVEAKLSDDRNETMEATIKSQEQEVEADIDLGPESQAHSDTELGRDSSASRDDGHKDFDPKSSDLSLDMAIDIDQDGGQDSNGSLYPDNQSIDMDLGMNVGIGSHERRQDRIHIGLEADQHGKDIGSRFTLLVIIVGLLVVGAAFAMSNGAGSRIAITGRGSSTILSNSEGPTLRRSRQSLSNKAQRKQESDYGKETSKGLHCRK